MCLWPHFELLKHRGVLENQRVLKHPQTTSCRSEPCALSKYVRVLLENVVFLEDIFTLHLFLCLILHSVTEPACWIYLFYFSLLSILLPNHHLVLLVLYKC